MKIYDTNLTGATAAESGRTQETRWVERDTGTATGGARGAAGDHIELSNTLNSLSRAMSAHNSDRAAKVQALAAQYQSGSYTVNSLSTSRAMVASALSGAGS
jgi:anti-sigma28 factor (negative regulator of flagellin synthesis)